MVEWLVILSASPIIDALGVLLTLIGFPISLWGLRLTYLQAKKAEQAANTAFDAVEAFKLRIDKYSAYRDIGEALVALDNTRRHLVKNAWSDACDSYETALRAVIRVRQSSVDFEAEIICDLDRVINQIKRFCDRVDAARAGKGSNPDAAKTLSAIRTNHEILATAKAWVEKEA